MANKILFYFDIVFLGVISFQRRNAIKTENQYNLQNIEHAIEMGKKNEICNKHMLFCWVMDSRLLYGCVFCRSTSKTWFRMVQWKMYNVFWYKKKIDTDYRITVALFLSLSVPWLFQPDNRYSFFAFCKSFTLSRNIFVPVMRVHLYCLID